MVAQMFIQFKNINFAGFIPLYLSTGSRSIIILVNTSCSIVQTASYALCGPRGRSKHDPDLGLGQFLFPGYLPLLVDKGNVSQSHKLTSVSRYRSSERVSETSTCSYMDTYKTHTTLICTHICTHAFMHSMHTTHPRTHPHPHLPTHINKQKGM